jgi:hypothetical integral membrane protein (TIGR02206 family)
MAASFELFGPAHLTAIALTFVAPLALCAVGHLYKSGITTTIIRWLFVSLLVGDEVLKLILLQRDGELTVKTAAPMHLCSWAVVTAVITLIYPNQLTYELCYFWALGGTLQALMTPDVSYAFPDPRFINFFTSHGGVIAAALYLTLCLGMRPVPMSIGRTLAWSTGYVIAAMTTNFLLDTNFGYLRAKPSNFSLLDYMAPWPYYIVQLVPRAIAFCLVCYSPFFIIDHLRGR